MITGSLQTDSPSLYSKLKRLFTISEISEFEASYQVISKEPKIRSENGWREKGVNFNPKPARILEILLECGITSKGTLLTALETLSDHETQASPEPNIRLALILDAIRHLSYQQTPQENYQHLKSEFIALQETFSNSPNLNRKLLDKVHSAFRLYQKFS